MALMADSGIDFGYVLAGQFLPDDDPQVRVQEALEQVRCARDAGFHSILVTQHFLADFQFLQPVPFLSRLLSEAGDMRIGTAVLQAGFYPPVLLAEELATLDVISGGRLIFGAGTGYRDTEFRAFGLPPQQRMRRFDEVIDVVYRLWSGESVTYTGEHVQLEDARLRLLPPQRDAVPLWVGATGPKGIRHAAEVGKEWVVSPELTLDAIAERQEVYRQALPRSVDPADKIYPIMREAYVAADREAAMKVAGSALRTKYDAYIRWGHAVGDFEVLPEDAFILGGVEHCVEQIQRYRERLGTRFIGMRMQWPGLDQREVVDSIAAFSHVIERC
ncbi:MAG: LLM class flavin-dependent oxidoreductase [Pseudonocardiaceae bacterium]|nr:LLM class flavin-dependent oxidoreductase [Pseudonocardiaceae bacterium]